MYRIGLVLSDSSAAAGEKSEEDKKAEQELAQFFERPNKDLQTLMDTFFPESHFSGFS